MRKTILAGFAALALSHPAAAQIAVESTASIGLSPAQEATIRRYGQERAVRPVIARERVVVGGRIPAGIDLDPLPPEVLASVPLVSPYRYFATDRGIVIVDPATRRVVRVID
ncbi:MAG TPA: DUF1236 domain-containing protein [Beijerinckiaceae bacterium]|nr:DUF1236 domain-containing protein [Beijerinckiaceae bacterium]